MGNFSRHTFDPLKNYVGVRLQQGVPVLDADWNELNDVTRQELYDTLSFTFTDGIPPGGFDFEVLTHSEDPKDFYILAGTGLIQGRPIRLRNNVRYATQPWRDPQRAARDGVAVIPPLTMNTGPLEVRTDIVYLDVWDREVGSFEDTNLINPAIGVETCVRLKREGAVRVAEGTAELPTAPAGHAFLPLALLRRPRNQEQITHIESIRPYLHSPQGTGVVSFFPAFLPVCMHSGQHPFFTKLPEWHITFATIPFFADIPKFRAMKPSSDGATGVLPLILPHRARLTSFSIHGSINNPEGQLQWQLLRITHQAADSVNARQLFDVLAEGTIRVLTGFTFGTIYGLSTIDPKLIVDNSRYYYALLAKAFSTPVYAANIEGVSIGFHYYGLAGPPTHEHD
jgi:hypothetical protein